MDTNEPASTGQVRPTVPPVRILSLDGGGAKGFYTLGVLREVEAMLGRPLCERFDLIFGTSTGAIIAALLALGNRVERIQALYEQHVPAVMAAWGGRGKSRALARLTTEVFGNASFTDVKTKVGIVATQWMFERPMIFKGDVAQAHGLKSTFVPGFGVNVGEAVQASCSAYPFFARKTVRAEPGDLIELFDGGYCANNPTLYAIADATRALGASRERLRVLSVGVGVYPQPKTWGRRIFGWLPSVRLLQKTLEVNTQSMDQLRSILFSDIQTVRISDTFDQPELATDFREHDLKKLNLLRQRGRASFAAQEAAVRALFDGGEGADTQFTT